MANVVLVDLCVSLHVSIHLFNKCFLSVTPAKGIILPHMAIGMTYFKTKYYIFEVSSPLKKYTLYYFWISMDTRTDATSISQEIIEA